MKPLTLLRWIAATVVGGHVLFLCWLGWTSSWNPPMAAKAPQKLVVQTVSVKDPLPLLAQAEPPPIPPQPSKTSEFPEGFQPEEEVPEEMQPLPAPPIPPKPQPIEIKHPTNEKKKPKWKAPVPKIDEPKKQKSKEAPKVTKKEAPKQNEALKKLLASAEDSIAKIDKNRDKGKASTSKVGAVIPGKIEALQIDAIAIGGEVLTGTEATYRDELAMRLRRLMRLPEYGEVKLKLTLDRSGKVAKVAIISAQSALNRTYVESTLPTLKFTDFGKNFTGQNQFTFMINLTNE